MRRKPSFFKFFLPGFADKSLEIPKAFVKHLDGGHSGAASLKGPTGTVWHVNMVENSGGVFLLSGWKRFVRDNFIQVGYCLLFRYHGKLRFTVKIFDTSACEAHLKPSYCCPSPIFGDNKRETVEGEEGCSLYEACVKKATCVPPNNGSLVGTLSRDNGLDKQVLLQKRLSEIQLTKGRKGNLYQFISQRRPVTAEEIKRAYNAAKSFRSRNPFASIVMRSSYVYRGFFLALPQAFTRSSLPKISSSMTLCDPSGKNWKIRYIYNQHKGKGCVSGGWASFVFANNIEEHDACVFELIQSNKIQVHIFRVVDEIAPLLEYPERLRRRSALNLF